MVCLFKGQKIIIPAALRSEMIIKVHTGHLGVTRTLERAKDNIFWPGMSKQITDHVLKCDVCLTHRNSNAKEPLIPHVFPDRPYQKIGTDLFYYDGKNYLLTIDYYSRFFEVDLLQDTRSATVIRKLKAHMSRNGICDILVSDNAPQYSSEEFKQFSRDWGFEHTPISPYHSCDNGLSEKGVGIAKKLLKKAKQSGQEPYLALLEYRNTPLECGYSPAQLLYNRRTKSVIPATNDLLKPKLVNDRIVQEKMQKSKSLQKQNHDKTSKSLSPLKVNDSVRIQFGKTWKIAKVIKIHNSRSYTVQTKEGGVYRRNRKLLIKTQDNTSEIQPLNANILADSDTPNEPLSSGYETDSPTSVPNSPRSIPGQSEITSTDQPYITRFGRISKASQRFSQ